MDIALHIETLNSFAHSYLTGNEQLDEYIRLKLAHSLRVLDNANLISESENLTGHTGDLCRLAALYHDIGRFPQLAKYKTFNDRESINHGRLGATTLRSFPLPGQLSDRDMRTIRFAVAQHNLKSIRPSLPEHLASPTQVVRDADKIDIFRVMIEHFTSDEPDPTVTHGFADVPDKYSMEIYDAVMVQHPADYTLIRYANDFKLILLGWLNDLHFASSLRLLVERRYIKEMFSLLPKDDKIKALEDMFETLTCYNCDSPS
ncbi:HD domain-containing protein [Pseudodesulfovibrio sp.]|nr:HD domain-containing protein [Pseudodesulfovibrio sp.]